MFPFMNVSHVMVTGGVCAPAEETSSEQSMQAVQPAAATSGNDSPNVYSRLTCIWLRYFSVSCLFLLTALFPLHLS